MKQAGGKSAGRPATRSAPRPVHPNQRLSPGQSRRNERRREQVRELVEQHVNQATNLPLTFAEIADLLGISRERVRQLAKEELGVGGRDRRGRLVGKRRWFGKKTGKETNQ